MRLVRHPSINCGASRAQKQERTSGGSARPVVCTTRRVDAVKHVFECSHIKDSNTCSFCLGFRPGAEGKPGWMDITVITPYRDGPLVVRGPFRMVDQDGAEIEIDRETVALCRCGRSRLRPFCDGSHKLTRFSAPSGAEDRQRDRGAPPTPPPR